VLATLGDRGSLLLQADGTTVLRQLPLPVPGGKVLDTTGAGDAFRGAFAVALLEKSTPAHALRFAAGAAAFAVSRVGAVPALPTRRELERYLAAVQEADASTPDSQPSPTDEAATGECEQTTTGTDTPPATSTTLQFASRLNSMRTMAAAWSGAHGTLGWVARQGTVQGLDSVFFNYPQHLDGLQLDDVRPRSSHARLSLWSVRSVGYIRALCMERQRTAHTLALTPRQAVSVQLGCAHA
jgi:hypothetical protein